MANLKDILRRIKSVTNTQKTTRAMKLVSTVKLKRAEEVAKSSREYADRLNDVITGIASRIQKHKIGGLESRFFNEHNPESVKKADLVFVTADKGLCGGFNAQTLKAVSKKLEYYKENKVKVRLRGVGKKGVGYFKFKGIELYDSAIGVSAAPSYEKAAEIIKKSVEDYANGLTDEVVLVYNGYKNKITQELKEITLLPVDVTPHLDEEYSTLLEFEPTDDESILDTLIQKYVEYNLYFALIDSLAGEHSARMQAMDSATNNAEDMIAHLTLSYNKARQEAITTELTEIVSGAESLKN